MAVRSRNLSEGRPQSAEAANGSIDRIGVGLPKLNAGQMKGTPSWLKNPTAGPRFTKRSAAHRTYLREQGYRKVKKDETGKEQSTFIPGFKRESSQGSVDYAELYSKAQYDYTVEVPSSEMISMIEYDSNRLWMRVTFKVQSTIIVYDHVPADTFFYLKEVVERTGKCGKVFWDVIRYRGQRVGSKVPYWYEYNSEWNRSNINFFDVNGEGEVSNKKRTPGDGGIGPSNDMAARRYAQAHGVEYKGPMKVYDTEEEEQAADKAAAEKTARKKKRDANYGKYRQGVDKLKQNIRPGEDESDARDRHIYEEREARGMKLHLTDKADIKGVKDIVDSKFADAESEKKRRRVEATLQKVTLPRM